MNLKQAEKKDELLRMSQRLKTEMSQVLLLRPVAENTIREAIVSKGVKVVPGFQQRERLRNSVKDIVGAVFKYLFDRQQNDGMLDPDSD